VDNNYLDLGMNQSGFVHTLPSGRLSTLLISKGQLILYLYPPHLKYV
jgi:hypothetical protein